MPIRNPFAKRSDLSNGFHNDENANPNATAGFERVDTTASKTSSAMSINSRNIEPMEYKLSGKQALPFERLNRFDAHATCV